MSDVNRPLPLPRTLLRAAWDEGREQWLDTLPGTVADLAERWSLEVGDPFQPGGHTAWVAPVADDRGGEMVLKVAWRHPESMHEAAGLRTWDGHAAVRLHAHLELGDTDVLLIEACRPGVPLGSRPEPEQDPIVADLLGRLWIVPEPGHPFRPLHVMCDAWADEFDARSDRSSLDPGLAREGITLFRSLPHSADRQVLLATDLHAGNVLAAEREPWLMVDPKPYVGDPAYDPLQHMLNCGERLHADPKGLANRMADLVGVDPGRLLLWLFARCVQEAPDWPELGEVARRIAPP